MALRTDPSLGCSCHHCSPVEATGTSRMQDGPPQPPGSLVFACCIGPTCSVAETQHVHWQVYVRGMTGVVGTEPWRAQAGSCEMGRWRGGDLGRYRCMLSEEFNDGLQVGDGCRALAILSLVVSCLDPSRQTHPFHPTHPLSFSAWKGCVSAKRVCLVLFGGRMQQTTDDDDDDDGDDEDDDDEDGDEEEDEEGFARVGEDVEERRTWHERKAEPTH